MPFSVVINVLHRSFVVCSAFAALSFLRRCCRKRSVSGRWLKPKTVGSDLFMSVRLVSVFHRAANIWAGKIPAIRRVFLFCAHLYARRPKSRRKARRRISGFSFSGRRFTFGISVCQMGRSVFLRMPRDDCPENGRRFVDAAGKAAIPSVRESEKSRSCRAARRFGETCGRLRRFPSSPVVRRRTFFRTAGRADDFLPLPVFCGPAPDFVRGLRFGTGRAARFRRCPAAAARVRDRDRTFGGVRTFRRRQMPRRRTDLPPTDAGGSPFIRIFVPGICIRRRGGGGTLRFFGSAAAASMAVRRKTGRCADKHGK